MCEDTLLEAFLASLFIASVGRCSVSWCLAKAAAVHDDDSNSVRAPMKILILRSWILVIGLKALLSILQCLPTMDALVEHAPTMSSFNTAVS